MAKASTYGCEQCKVMYRMGRETTILLFLKQPWFNHLMTTCPTCHITWYVWQLDDGAIRYMQDNNMKPDDKINVTVTDFAEDVTVKAFCEATDSPYHEDRYLSPRELQRIDNQVGYFAYLLQQGEMP